MTGFQGCERPVARHLVCIGQGTIVRLVLFVCRHFGSLMTGLGFGSEWGCMGADFGLSYGGG